jgi:hypothetical protein
LRTTRKLSVAATASLAAGGLIAGFVGSPGVGFAGPPTSGGAAPRTVAQIRARTAAPSAACDIGGPTGQVKHVIEVVFDNVHFNRDNPDVLSDIEQMPALEHFIEDNGTLLSNNHTPLIAHTADDTITNYSGLYGDRSGVANANDYYDFTDNGASTSSEQSSFTYWTAPGVDSYPAMDYSASVPASDPTDATPPAPWVPFTRAGCDVGAVATSNMELENLTPDIDTVFGAGSPEAQQLSSDKSEYQDQETNDYIGLAVHCASGDPLCGNAKAAKYGQTTATYDAVADDLPSEPGGYGGTSPSGSSPGFGYLALFGHKELQNVLDGAANASSSQAQADHCKLIGASAFVAGALYRVDRDGDCYEVADARTNGQSNGGTSADMAAAADNGQDLVDLFGSEIDGEYSDAPGPGFPGFGPITAAQSLAYVADMQETGVPVTYAYISDVHEVKDIDTGPCSPASTYKGKPDVGYADGPGDTCYYQTTAAWNQAFQDFFQRLADDGITPANTLFVFGADEGDHFNGPNVGRAQVPACSGTPLTTSYHCTYASGDLGEVDASIHTLLALETGDHTAFTDEPQGDEVYVTGNQPESTIRQLERDYAKVTVHDQYDQSTETAVKWMVNSTGEQLLHFGNADPARIPTFTVWPKPDIYFSDGTSDSCAAGTTAATAAKGCVTIESEYGWNHGYYAPEINNTWLGLVGPGVRHIGIDGSGPGGGPSSAGDANSGDETDTQLHNPGTWIDQSDARPTLMYLTGLKDDYTEDGRVITPVLDAIVLAADPAIDSSAFEGLAECYKQLNSSVGEFGTDVITSSTAALESGSSSADLKYSSFETALQALGASRDALAGAIKQALWNAEFDHTPLPGANGLLAGCDGVLTAANTLAGSTH